MRTFLCLQAFPCARRQVNPGDEVPESDVDSARTYEGWSEDFVKQVYPEPEAPPPPKVPALEAEPPPPPKTPTNNPAL